ncbi:uncharacterized protein [Triticum aestivum]|uniref:uncharacterized protein n=1 Tax=Triticum aestivum TaxID=4565 RepID=UPI001D006AEC|nr:uncharacterized protein LOC123088614 [Triticum aestivum]
MRGRAPGLPAAPVASKDRADVATNLRSEEAPTRVLQLRGHRRPYSGLVLQGARRARGLPGFGVGPPRLGARRAQWSGRPVLKLGNQGGDFDTDDTGATSALLPALVLQRLQGKVKKATESSELARRFPNVPKAQEKGCTR